MMQLGKLNRENSDHDNIHKPSSTWNKII